MYKKLLILSFVLVCLLSISAQSSLAQSPSPDLVEETDEETAESSPAATIKELQKRIQKISEENREKIKGALDKLEQKKRALIGSVQRVSEEALTIKGRSGTTIISVDENLTFLKGTKEIDLSDIEVDNWVTAMGTLVDESLQVEVVLVSDESLRPKNDKIDIGTITELTTKEITISSRKDQSEKVYSINTGTTFNDPSGEEVTSSLFSEDITVVIIGYTDDDESLANTIQSLAPLDEE